MKLYLIALFLILDFVGFSQQWENALVNAGLRKDAYVHAAMTSSNIYTVFETDGNHLAWQNDTQFYFSNPFVVSMVKLNRNLDLLSFESIQSDSGLTVFDFAVDSDNSVYVFGLFRKELYYKDSTLATVNGNAHYLVKLDSNLNLQYLRIIKANNGNIGQIGDIDRWGSIVVDLPNLDIYLSAPFYKSAIYRQDTISQVYANDKSDVYIIKLSDSGDLRWVNVLGSSGYDYCKLKVKDSYLYATGSCTSSTLKSKNSTLLVNSNFGQISFLLRLNQAGEITWAKGAYNVDFGIIFGMNTSVDSLGNVYWLGHFSASQIELDSKQYYGYAGIDLYITKIDSSGTVIWFNVLKSSGSVSGLDLVNDNLDAIVSVRHTSNVYFNSDTIFANHFMALNSTILRLDSGGNLKSYNQIEGTSSNEIQEFDISNSKLLVSGQVNIGAVNFDYLNFKPVANNNIFLALFDFDKSVGIDNKLLQVNRVFPNPTNGLLTIEFSEYMEKANLELIDDKGRVLNACTFSGTEYNLLLNIAKGIYFIRITRENRSSRYLKIVKY